MNASTEAVIPKPEGLKELGLSPLGCSVPRAHLRREVVHLVLAELALRARVARLGAHARRGALERLREVPHLLRAPRVRLLQLREVPAPGVRSGAVSWGRFEKAKLKIIPEGSKYL